MSDGRLQTLKHADPAEVASEQTRYRKTADTLDDAVTKLQKIIDGAADANVGQWVKSLKDDATTIQEDLKKAARRYDDAANYIKDYEPELDIAIDAVARATADQGTADTELTGAKSMPDAQKSPDGTISPEEQQKAADKQKKIDAAQSDLTAATNRLTAALDALDVAGKRLGDAVNCKNYDDGLTDSTHDKIMEAFGWISKIFGYLALVFTVLAFLIPGLNILAIAGAVAGAVLLISDSVLYAGGEGSLLNVILDAVGLGLAGFGAGFGKLFKGIGELAKGGKGLPGIKIQWLLGADGGRPSLQLIVPGKPLVTFGPKPYFFSKPGQYDFWKTLGTKWWSGVSDIGTWKSLTSLNVFGTVFNFSTVPFKVIWSIWGGLNNMFNLGASIGFAGYQINQSLQDG